MNRILLIALLALSFVLPGRAAASSPAERQQLLETIARARRDRPKTFESLASLKRRMPELDRRKRGPFAVVTPMLKAMGPGALPALLEELVADRPMPEGSAPTARVAFRVGLIEAAAASHEPLAAPVLRDLVQQSGEHAQVVRAAAAGLGELGDDASVALLVRLVREPGPRQGAVAAGMGRCRTLEAVRTLAELLRARPEPALARTLVKSLGEAGNAWAWETPALAARADGATLRAAVAKALVGAWVGYTGEVREAAEKQLLVVDAPETPALLAQARERPGADVAGLERLESRLTASPLRRQGR